LAVTNYDISSAAYRKEGAHDYELSILTGMDSFAYTIRDRTQNQLLAYHSQTIPTADLADWPETINRIIQADDKLRSVTYGNCILGWESERLTLVPEKLYDASNASAYLEQLTLISLEDTVRTERYQQLGGELLFAAPTPPGPHGLNALAIRQYPVLSGVGAFSLLLIAQEIYCSSIPSPLMA